MKKIGNSFSGIIGGIVFILIGVILLWWNEGNNVRNLKTTGEMEKTYIDVKSDTINPENEGKLIATYGPLINEEELTDETFNVTLKTPVLQRIVEVYQWQESQNTDDDGNTTYSYSKVWSNEIISSDNFAKSGHDNPAMKLYEDEKNLSSDVRVGAFTLSSNQVDMLSTDGTFNEFDSAKAEEMKLHISGNYLTTSEDLNKPAIGDTRISFVYNNSTDVSVLAVQSGNTFTDFVSKVGKSINRVMDGTHSGKEMINVIKKENKILKWALRAAGLLLCTIGFLTILKPISATTSYIPVLGSVVGGVVGLISFILGLALSLVVIAIAWIRFRPTLGLILLAVVIALVVFLIIRGKNSKVAETSEASN